VGKELERSMTGMTDVFGWKNYKIHLSILVWLHSLQSYYAAPVIAVIAVMYCVYSIGYSNGKIAGLNKASEIWKQE